MVILPSVTKLLFWTAIFVAYFGYSKATSVTGFEIAAGGTNLIELAAGTSTNIDLVFTDGDSPSLTAQYDVAVSLTGTVSSNTAQLVIDSTVSNQVPSEFGTYLLTMTLTPGSGSAQSKEVVVFYEEAIEGFEVSGPAYVAVDEPFNFTVVFTKGSNVELEWFLDENSTCLEEYTGLIRSSSRDHNFTTAAENNITIVAANTVARTYTNVIVVSQYLVQQFNMTINEGPIQTTESAVITVTLGADAPSNMGSVMLEIDYDDNSAVQNISLNSHMATMKGAGYQLTHQYSIQGNYTITARIFAELNSLSFTLNVYVWDSVTVCLSADITKAKSSEAITFSFNSVPPSGFMYNVEYGDGSPDKQNTEAALSSAYNEAAWTKSYTSPGIYTVTMAAWNPFYVSICDFEITVQHAIEETQITLSPSSDTIPLPDGVVDFTLGYTVSAPTPTNVTCNFDFDELEELNVSTEIIYGLDIEKQFVFNTSGVKSVNFTCWNLVSSATWLSSIDVKAFSLSDFVISHLSKTSMNMSAQPDANGYLMPVSEASEVSFTVSLLGCSRPPPNIQFAWNFGDGSATQTETLTSFQKTHTYSARGSYQLNIDITSTTDSRSITPQTVQLGIVFLTADKYTGQVNAEAVTFTATGFDSNGDYEIFFDYNDESSTTSNSLQATATKTYPVWGSFLPYVIATNGSNFYEIAYLDQPFRSDYLIDDGYVEYSNLTVYLPPGILLVNISVLGFERPMVVCNVNSGDLIDTSWHTYTHNISNVSPINLNITYWTLGDHEFVINCTNFLDTFYNSTYVAVKNPCFSENGIFVRDYSSPETAMQVFTSVDTDLTNGMAVYCFSQTPGYEWTMKRVVDDNEVPFEYIDTLSPAPRGSVRFTRGRIPPGTYVISLNVTLEETWAFEFTYLNFRRPPAYCSIKGGSERIMSRSIIVVDGYTDSYDQEGGYGARGDLNFTLSCYRFNETKETIQEMFDQLGGIQFFANDSVPKNNTMLDEANECLSFEEISPGKMRLNATSLDFMAYLIIQRIDLDQADSSFSTQIITMVPGDPPIGDIGCIINCRDKIAVQSKITRECRCDNCQPEELSSLKCQWSLEREFSNGTTIPVDNFADMCETRIDEQQLVIKANTLEPGVMFKLIATLSLPGRTEKGVASRTLIINLPPYGGSCAITPDEGYALSSKFDVTCDSWKDEGLNTERDPTADENQVLTYEFIRELKKNISGQVTTTSSSIFSGNSATASQLQLQLGDPSFDYEVTVMVRITDYFGDSVENRESVAKVMRNESMVPSDANDIGPVLGLFDMFDKNKQEVEAGGNDMAVVSVVAEMSSFINSVDVGDQGDVPNYFRNKTLDMMKTVRSAIPNNTDDRLSVGDSGNVVGAINTMLSNDDISTDEIRAVAVDAAVTLAKSLEKTVDQNPFPVEDIPGINNVVNGVMDLISTTSLGMTPSSVESLSVEITKESIREEFSYNSSDSMTAEEQAEFDRRVDEEYERRIAAQEQTRIKSETAKGSVPQLSEIIEKILKITASQLETGEEVETLSRSNCEITAEKARLQDFQNGTSLNKTGFAIEFGNTTTDGFVQLQLQTAYFKSPPLHFYGTGGSKIKSGEITISWKDENGTSVNPNTTLKIGNEGPGISFQDYQQEVSEDGLIHVVFDLPDKEDAVLLYIKPKDFSFADLSSFNLYNVYVRCIDFARVTVYDFRKPMGVRDWEDSDFGFKVFVPQGLCDPGRTYIGLEAQEDFILPPQSNTMRKKRSASATTTAAPIYQMSTANFSLIIFTTGCRTWDAANQAWSSQGCTVLEFSTINETVCRCPEPPGNTFATTFYVPPNTIDFSTVFSKFDASNASVYGTVIALIVVYIIACVFARREDKKDYDRWATHFLCDSDNEDKYFYLITVHTGLRRGAGTKSLVNFVLAGEDMDSGVRIMSDGDRLGFETSSVRKFFMGTPEPLGDLTYLRIWHDSSGKGDNKSWYLHKVTIDDPQIGKRYIFLCDKWLAAEQDDGLVERLLPVCGRDNLLTFDKLFSEHARFNLTENHLWLSMVLRPEQSSFTRVQRLSCILALLFLTMIANAMFFRSEDESVSPDSVSIGFIRFSLTTLYISFIGILITTPPILLVTFIYKKSKPKFPNNKKLSKKTEKEVRNIFQTKTILNQNEHFSDSEFYSVDHLPLPSWSRYVAWVIVVLAVITSAFFLILYSMEWGKAKSEEWLTTFVFSFFESLIIVDPFKVILIAVLFALLFKKPVESGGPQLNMNRLRDAAKTFNAGSSRTYLSFRMDVLSTNSPPSLEALEKTRLQRLNELKAREVFMELIMYGIFAFVIYSISFVNRDQRAFYLKDNIYNSLVAPHKDHLGFSKVIDARDFIQWINETFYPRYFPQTDYNGAALGVQDELFFRDLDNARIGPPRFRQVRMKRGACPYDKVTPGRECIPAYEIIDEDEKDYCVGWTSDVAAASCTSSQLFTQDAWRYQHSDEIWGVSIAGEFDVYGGGGYILKLENGLEQSRLILSELERYKWINRETRAVFLEFTLYNANTNLFAYVIFLAEFTELGGLVTWNDIYTFRPYQHTGALGTFAMLCYFIYLIVMIYGTVKLILKMRKLGCCQFISDVWNCIDTLCAMLSYVGVVMWSLRYAYSKESLAVYYNNKKAFINFQHVVVWDIVFNVIIGVLVFIATIRILRILGYNKRMTQLAAVISNASGDLCGFGVVFGIVFFAYVSFGYLLFGPYIYEYRNLFTSLGSLANALIGKNSLDSMIRAVPSWSQLYYFTYVFFVILTLMTMFAVILNQSISEVRADLMKVPQTYGIMDILGNSVKDILGMAFKMKSKEVPEKENPTRNYMPAVGKRPPELDAPNILRLVRETFGETWDNEEQPDEEEMMRRKKAEEQLLILDSYLHPTPGAKGGKGGKLDLHRPQTPGDVRLTVDTPAVDQEKLYSSYL